MGLEPTASIDYAICDKVARAETAKRELRVNGEASLRLLPASSSRPRQ
jgi:hypothetical protein